MDAGDLPRRRGRHAPVLWTMVLAMVGVLAVMVPSPAQAATTDLYLGNFYFSSTPGGPGNTAITVDNGDQVRFVAENAGHTVEIPELGISRPLRAGESFTTGPLTRAGTFSVHCAPHRGAGQQTTLTVRAAAAAAPAPEPQPAPEPAPAPEPTRAPAPAPAPAPASAPSAAPAPPARSQQPAAAAPGGAAPGAADSGGAAPGGAAEPAAAELAAGQSGSGSTPSAGPDTSGSPEPSPGSAASDDTSTLESAPTGPVDDASGTNRAALAALLLLPLLGGAAWVVVRRRRGAGEPAERGAAEPAEL